MPPAGYPAFLQYLQSGRVRKIPEGIGYYTRTASGGLPGTAGAASWQRVGGTRLAPCLAACHYRSSLCLMNVTLRNYTMNHQIKHHIYATERCITHDGGARRREAVEAGWRRRPGPRIGGQSWHVYWCRRPAGRGLESQAVAASVGSAAVLQFVVDGHVFVIVASGLPADASTAPG